MPADLLIKLSAEEKLLISLCRIDFSEDQKTGISLLVKRVSDWERFVNLANRHGVIALCWFNLSKTDNTGVVPARQLERLHSAYMKSLTRNTRISGYLEEIISIAAEEKIQIVLLKGIALEYTEYGNQGIRQMSDIDILIRKNEVFKLRNALLNRGYKSEALKSPLYKHILFHIGKHLPTIYKDDCPVDIHLRLFDGNDNRLTDEFFDASVPLEIKGRKVFIPEPQLLFLYLIRHINLHEKSGLSALKFYADLNVLINSHYDKIVNRKLLNLAAEAGLEKEVIGKLLLLKTFFGVTFPGWLSDLVSEPDHTDVLAKFLATLANPAGDISENRQSEYLNTVKAIPGLFNKILFITGFIFPSFDFMKRRYRINYKALVIFYYPLRVIRVFINLVKGNSSGNRC